MSDKNDKMSKALMTYDEMMREATGDEIAALTPPTGRYIPVKLRRAVFERDGHACFFCGKHKDQLRKGDLTLDHFIPRALGGTNTFDNLFAACRSCNSRKGKIGPAWIARRMALGIRKFGV